MGVVCGLIRSDSKNRHQKVRASKEIRLRAHKIFTNLGTIVNLSERTYMTIFIEHEILHFDNEKEMTCPPQNYKRVLAYESYLIVPCR
jgi:hypothetical protein